MSWPDGGWCLYMRSFNRQIDVQMRDTVCRRIRVVHLISSPLLRFYLQICVHVRRSLLPQKKKKVTDQLNCTYRSALSIPPPCRGCVTAAELMGLGAAEAIADYKGWQWMTGLRGKRVNLSPQAEEAPAAFSVCLCLWEQGWEETRGQIRQKFLDCVSAEFQE